VGGSDHAFVLMALFALIGFSVIGFIDDYAKVAKKQNLGLTTSANFFTGAGHMMVGVGCLELSTHSAYSRS